VIGFGGRILTADPKQPKYVNSPESEIYNKSKSLYGIFFAKKSISQNDECFLVEGYTDVISLHQSGIENAVASSGTSLTQEQIRLISRYTKNVTILYDGDFAGIKASLRGIDLILEEGLNVKVVLFPDGDDPDSYAKKVSVTELKEYIKSNAKDFIGFKTGLLLKEAANDPVKKAGLIRDIVTSISKIPDGITRSTYIQQCSIQLEIAEQVLVNEMNKLRRDAFKKQSASDESDAVDQLFDSIVNPEQNITEENDTYHQEKEIIRLLMNYGDKEFIIEQETEEKEFIQVKYLVRDFILTELGNDEIELHNVVFSRIFNLFKTNSSGLNQQFFFQHSEEEVKKIAFDLISEKHELSEEWENKGIFIKREEQLLRHAVMSTVYMLKIKRVQQLKKENQEEIKRMSESGSDVTSLLEQQRLLENVKSELTKYLGIVVVK
jgi:DNA primase